MNVKIARMKKHMTQQELCKLVNIGRNHLIRIEKGQYDALKIGIAKRIAEVLDTSFEELFLKEN